MLAIDYTLLTFFQFLCYILPNCWIFLVWGLAVGTIVQLRLCVLE